jgi:voltage-gated potassium channel Kch
MDFALSFLQLFWLILKVAFPIILLLVTVIVVLGQIAGRFEKWDAMQTLYWSFITATTVGYGDFPPISRMGRFLAVIIAFSGLILFGVIASLAVIATTEAARLHADLSDLQAITGPRN